LPGLGASLPPSGDPSHHRNRSPRSPTPFVLRWPAQSLSRPRGEIRHERLSGSAPPAASIRRSDRGRCPRSRSAGSSGRSRTAPGSGGGPRPCRLLHASARETRPLVLAIATRRFSKSRMISVVHCLVTRACREGREVKELRAKVGELILKL